jgi:SAM-dependent methyltransferase
MGCCCRPFESAATRQFDQKKVARELRRYREKGPESITQLLADGIAKAGALRGTVLDVGAGLGGLTFALLEGGATEAVVVDASTAYVEAARHEAIRSGRAEAIRFVHADFVDAASELPVASIVTLDRVICCYPLWRQLLHKALEHTETCLALSYPRDVWYVRWAMMLENRLRWLRRNSFRTFVHPIAVVEDTIRRAGFRLASRRETWTWSADVYVR